MDMVYIGKGTYIQLYYSENYFTIVDVIDDERVRLSRLGVDVLYHEVCIGENDHGLLFSLYLYFRGNPKRELDYNELFGNFK